MSQPVVIGRELPWCGSTPLRTNEERHARCQSRKSDFHSGRRAIRTALAAELSRRGVSAAIIDRQAAGANTSRACVVDARTMEVLEPLGVTRDLLAEE